MSDHPPPATHKKACLCAIKPLRGPLYAATGKTNAQGHSEFKCRLCGATEWGRRATRTCSEPVPLPCPLRGEGTLEPGVGADRRHGVGEGSASPLRGCCYRRKTSAWPPLK